MISFNSLGAAIHNYQRITPLHDAIIQHQLIRLDDAGEDQLHFDWEKIRRLPVPNLENFVQMLARSGVQACIECVLFARMMSEGVKVFLPSDEECLALEQIDVRIPMADYHQPFPTMAIEFPQAYRSLRLTAGTDLNGKPVSHKPLFAIIGQMNADTIWVTIYLDSGAILTHSMVGHGRMIEDLLGQGVGVEYSPECPVTIDEEAMSSNVRRLAINSMLLLCENSVCLGPTNPEHLRRTQKHMEKARKRGESLTEYERQMRSVPFQYALDQSIQLYHSRSSHAETEPSDRNTRPHWRRGHWRNQRHGEAYSLIKRVFIAPIMVNADQIPAGHRFSTSYRLGG